MEYGIRISGCPETCDGVDKDCNEPDGQGCRCIDGFVLSGVVCVRKDSCGCRDGAKYYKVRKE